MIRNWILFVAIFTATLAGLSAAETAAKPATKKTAPTTKAVPKKSAPKKSTAPQSKSPARRPATATKSTKTTKGKAGSRPAPVVKRYRQAQPTPDRYKEIQEALVAKGYLKGEPTGVWDAQSVEALKKFQSDKNLVASGKITAPALIELGLGPKNQPLEGPPPGLPSGPVPDPHTVEPLKP